MRKTTVFSKDRILVRAWCESMKESENLYDYPAYYETAFSFRDIGREAKVFDECIRQYSRTPIRRVLD